MLVNVRFATPSLGRWLLPALIVPSALACSAPAEAPSDPERAFVETPSGRRISFTAGKPGESASTLTADVPFVIAKFGGPISREAHKALALAGYREVGYLPYDALLLERLENASDRAVPGMIAQYAYLPADRISRELEPESLARSSSQSNVPVMIHVMPGHDVAGVRDAVIARGGRIAGQGKAGAFTRITAIFPAQTVADDARILAEKSEILFLERIHHIGLLNDKAVGTMQSGMQGHDAAQTPIWQHGIRGENQIVAVIDTGLDANACYFGDMALPTTNTWSDTGGYATATDPTHRKIVAYDFLYSCDQYPMGASCETPSNLAQWDTQNHGTHVSGCMVGDSDSNPETYANEDGQAPAAKIVVQDAGYAVDECGDLPGIGCPVINLEPVYEQSFKQGARAHNNSYGDNENAPSPGASNYSARSADIDHFMWEHKDFLIVHAAGNNANIAGSMTGQDFSVISPSTNKDGLSVGSARKAVTSTSDDDISSFSSRGWTGDGRIKPDLMAPGCNASARNDRNVGGAANCTTDSGCGTSYASPTAVGTAALVRQYFVDGFYPSGAKSAADALTPTAALVKAVLLNSSQSMKGTDNSGGSISPIPSNEQGWGRIQLDRTLVFAGGARKLLIDDHRTGMAAGSTTPVTYTLNNVDASQPLKVTLVWTDYPAMPDSPPAGVPTLDDPSSWSAPRLVNDLDLTVKGPSETYLGNVFADGASTTGGKADARNNVEQVLLATPAAGTYTITVMPTAIVQDGQDFALVVTGAWGSSTGTTDGGGGADGTSGDGGPAGTGGAGGAGTAGTGGTGGTGGTNDGSCNCNIGHRDTGSWTGLLLFGFPVLLPLRRRRRSTIASAAK